MEGYMNLDRGPFYNKGISPRQRRVFILRWNPSISSFSLDDFEDEFAQLQGTKPFDNEHPLDFGMFGIGKRLCTGIYSL
jgi:hypothetical protein